MLRKLVFILIQISIIVIAIFIFREWFSPEKAAITKEITKALVQNQSFLIKRELILESIIKKEESGQFWGTDKKALIITKGKVPYGIDFNEFSSDDVKIDLISKDISITVPSPKIYEVIITDLVVYDVTTGIFSSHDAYLKKIYQTVFEDAKQTLKAEALQQLNDQADQRIKNELLLSLSTLIHTLYGDFNIEINYKAVENDSIPVRMENN